MSQGNHFAWSGTEAEEEELTNLVKYLAHGVLFAIVMLPYGLAIYYFIRSGPFTGDLLLTTGIHLLIAYGTVSVVALAFGLANSYLARALWGVRPKKTVTNLVEQGFLLLAMMMFFLTLWALISIEENYNVVVVAFITFISDALVSGYVGRHIALEFVSARESKEKRTSLRNRRWTCPNCGTSFVSRNVDDVTCPECQRVFHAEDEGTELDSA